MNIKENYESIRGDVMQTLDNHFGFDSKMNGYELSGLRELVTRYEMENENLKKENAELKDRIQSLFRESGLMLVGQSK